MTEAQQNTFELQLKDAKHWASVHADENARFRAEIDAARRMAYDAQQTLEEAKRLRAELRDLQKQVARGEKVTPEVVKTLREENKRLRAEVTKQGIDQVRRDLARARNQLEGVRKIVERYLLKLDGPVVYAILEAIR